MSSNSQSNFLILRSVDHFGILTQFYNGEFKNNSHGKEVRLELTKEFQFNKCDDEHNENIFEYKNPHGNIIRAHLIGNVTTAKYCLYCRGNLDKNHLIGIPVKLAVENVNDVPVKIYECFGTICSLECGLAWVMMTSSEAKKKNSLFSQSKQLICMMAADIGKKCLQPAKPYWLLDYFGGTLSPNAYHNHSTELLSTVNVRRVNTIAIEVKEKM